MKKLFLFISIILLLCGCHANEQPNPFPLDLSCAYVETLTNFKCYATHNGNTFLVDGDTARELYEILWDSMTETAHKPSKSESNSIYLVFYNSPDNDYLSANDVEFYGSYSVYAEGFLVFSLSPLHSASFDYCVDPDIYNALLEKLGV